MDLYTVISYRKRPDWDVEDRYHVEGAFFDRGVAESFESRIDHRRYITAITAVTVPNFHNK